MSVKIQKGFSAARKGFGTREWAEHSVNVCIGCSHDCLYCYARKNALDTGKIKKASDWSSEQIITGIEQRTFQKLSGVVMFPTQHDITPNNIETCLGCLYKILACGNSVLIVSKPHLECIRYLCDKLASFKQQILFRFTIGSTQENICKFWETGAPPPRERIEALKFAFYAGYQTSVSAEPMLEGFDGATDLYRAVFSYISDEIWFGKMNFPRRRVDLSKPENVAAVEQIEKMQNDNEIKKLYSHYQSTSSVAWKDSIKKVVGL